MAGSLREGTRLYRARKWEMALAEFLQVDSDGPDSEENVELAYYLGLCYTKLARYDDALLYLEQVVTGDDDEKRSDQCRLALAYVYAATGRTRLAEFELKRLVQKGKETAQVFSALGYAAWHQKRVEPAVEYYGKALELEGENPTALNGLGYVLTDSDLDPRKGLSLCKKAVDRKPQNPAYLDSLGWAYFKNGNLPEARTWLRRALDLSPRHPEITTHMKVVVGESL